MFEKKGLQMSSALLFYSLHTKTLLEKFSQERKMQGTKKSLLGKKKKRKRENFEDMSGRLIVARGKMKELAVVASHYLSHDFIHNKTFLNVIVHNDFVYLVDPQLK